VLSSQAVMLRSVCSTCGYFPYPCTAVHCRGDPWPGHCVLHCCTASKEHSDVPVCGSAGGALQVVHELLQRAQFSVFSQPQQVILMPLQLQLPISALYYSRLQAKIDILEEALQLAPAATAQTATPAAHSEEDANMADAQHDGVSQQQYRLDALLLDALGDEQLAVLLSKHSAAFIQDLLLLAEEGFTDTHSIRQQGVSAEAGVSAGTPDSQTSSSSSSSSLGGLGDGAVQVLQQLLHSQQAPELQAIDHPLSWLLFIKQQRPQLQALARLCSLAAASPRAGPAATADRAPFSIVHAANTETGLDAVIGRLYTKTCCRHRQSWPARMVCSLG